MVYLLDPVSGTGMSVDQQNLAQAISERYPAFRLAQVPLSVRSKVEPFPYAILYAPTGEVVKELRESDMNINTIFTWLYMNDSAVHGERNLYAKFKAEQDKKIADKKYASDQRRNENLEVFHSIANSKLHTYKHGGRTFG